MCVCVCVYVCMRVTVCMRRVSLARVCLDITRVGVLDLLWVDARFRSLAQVLIAISAGRGCRLDFGRWLCLLSICLAAARREQRRTRLCQLRVHRQFSLCGLHRCLFMRSRLSHLFFLRILISRNSVFRLQNDYQSTMVSQTRRRLAYLLHCSVPPCAWILTEFMSRPHERIPPPPSPRRFVAKGASLRNQSGVKKTRGNVQGSGIKC